MKPIIKALFLSFCYAALCAAFSDEQLILKGRMALQQRNKEAAQEALQEAGEWDNVITRIARDLSALTLTAHTQSC